MLLPCFIGKGVGQVKPGNACPTVKMSKNSFISYHYDLVKVVGNLTLTPKVYYLKGFVSTAN